MAGEAEYDTTAAIADPHPNALSQDGCSLAASANRFLQTSPTGFVLHQYLVLPRQTPAVSKDEEWRKEADVRAWIRALLRCGRCKNSCRRA